MNSINDIWNEVLRVLSKQLTQTAINTWFSDCVPVELDDCCLVLSTPNEFKRNIITSRFLKIIKDTLSDLFSCDFDVMLLIDDDVQDYVEGKNGNDDKNPLPEMEGYTFDRFIVGKTNEFAYAAAMAVADKPGSVNNPLLIYGNSGLGKTHLLLAIGQSIHARNKNAQIAYVKGDDFTNQLVASIREGKQEEFRLKYRKVDLLLVDDIQFIAGKQQTQNEFFHTFNDIYEAGHQIVITSDRPPMEMALLDDRLRTRFEGGLLVDIQPPDLETRMAIIRNKAGQIALRLSDECVEYIAREITANVRQLEGVVKKLSAYSNLLSKEITLEEVRRAIDDVTHQGVYIPKPKDIIHETARYYSLKDDDLRGQSKGKVISNARHISMYLMRTLTSLSLQEIGAQYENRNHSTVLSSIRKIEDQIKTDRELSSTISDISANINSTEH